MRWFPWRRPAVQSESAVEAEAAKCEAQRALLDAHNFNRRAEAIGRVSEQIKRRNHIGEAVELVIRPRRAR